MSAVDIVIIIVVALIMLSIIFFSIILPKIKGRKAKCAYCPVNKGGKIKRAFKDYKKSENK